jgi:hypothetical protein
MNIWQEEFAETSLYRPHNNRVEATAKGLRASPLTFDEDKKRTAPPPVTSDLPGGNMRGDRAENTGIRCRQY